MKNSLDHIEQNKIIQAAIVKSIADEYPIKGTKKTLRLKKV